MPKDANSNKLRKLIVDVIASQPEAGLRRVDIRRYVGNADETYFRDTFKQLVADGTIVKKRGGRFVCAEALSLRRGIIHVNTKGYGFVHCDDLPEDVFIPPEATNGAMSDDTVLIEIISLEDARGPVGMVKKIVSRGHESFVGCLHFSENGYVIRPIRRELPPSLPLAAEYGEEDPLCGASEGDWVQATLVPGRTPLSPFSAQIVHRLSEGGSITHDLNAIVKEYGLPKKYTPAEEQKAVAPLKVEVPREDLRHLMMVTIDPIDAKDFDDAVSCQAGEVPEQVIIGVHIADVACYVTPDSDLDLKARSRGFTSYLPGRTIPMLPSVLATDICSLRAGEDRQACSVLMTVDKNTGRVISSRRVHSLIHVTRRMTFEEVSRILENPATSELDITPELRDMLLQLGQMTVTMRQYRAEQEQFLPLTVQEYRVLTGGRPLRVQDVVRNETNPASELVEECMLAANVQVASELQTCNIPALYRNHATPEERSLDSFGTLAGVVMRRKKAVNVGTRDALVRFLGKLTEGTTAELLALSFLRCLPRAEYDMECHGHFGLGKEIYCHFTSPIRRYPDLLVHQQLLAYDLKQPLRDEAFMRECAQECNALEQNIDQASFAALDRMKLRYLNDQRLEQPGLCHEAYVMRATSDGLQVYLPSVGLMGMLDKEQFGGSWRYDAKTSTLSNRSGQGYRCGDVIYVQLKSIDVVHGDLELKPVQMSV